MKFILTATTFIGELHFTYNELGKLRHYESLANLSEVQQNWLEANFPFAQNKLKDFISFRIKVVSADLSFSIFWKEYDYKVGNKLKVEKLWNALDEADCIAVLEHIPAYKRYLKNSNLAQAYPETFLNQRRWENELPKPKKTVYGQ